MSKPVFTVSIDSEKIVSVDGEPMSGDALLESAAMIVAACVNTVERTWENAHGKKSGENAAQCCINRAGVILNRGSKIIEGRIVTKTE